MKLFGNIGESLSKEVQKLLAEMKQLPIKEIRKLPESNSRSLIMNNRKVTLTTWIDHYPESCRVVVQAYDRAGGLMGQMSADGFRISQTGEISPLKEDEIYDFL